MSSVALSFPLIFLWFDPSPPFLLSRFSGSRCSLGANVLWVLTCRGQEVTLGAGLLALVGGGRYTSMTSWLTLPRLPFEHYRWNTDATVHTLLIWTTDLLHTRRQIWGANTCCALVSVTVSFQRAETTETGVIGQPSQKMWHFIDSVLFLWLEVPVWRYCKHSAILTWCSLH